MDPVIIIIVASTNTSINIEINK